MAVQPPLREPMTDRSTGLVGRVWEQFFLRLANASNVVVGAITGLTGDVTATGPGVVPATLSATGVVAGSYTNTSVTFDAKGRATTASSGASPAPATAEYL